MATMTTGYLAFKVILSLISFIITVEVIARTIHND